MNATTSSAREGAAGSAVGGISLWLRPSSSLYGAARDALSHQIVLLKHSGQHQLHFQHVLPMFPVNFVTYLSGCSGEDAS